MMVNHQGLLVIDMLLIKINLLGKIIMILKGLVKRVRIVASYRSSANNDSIHNKRATITMNSPLYCSGTKNQL
jgi:hypothetical protein